jgi:hypothetical protein
MESISTSVGFLDRIRRQKRSHAEQQSHGCHKNPSRPRQLLRISRHKRLQRDLRIDPFPNRMAERRHCLSEVFELRCADAASGDVPEFFAGGGADEAPRELFL